MHLASVPFLVRVIIAHNDRFWALTLAAYAAELFPTSSKPIARVRARG